MMKKLFIATCLLLPGLVYSAATPLPSGFDARMQTVSYNGANTTEPPRVSWRVFYL